MRSWCSLRFPSDRVRPSVQWCWHTVSHSVEPAFYNVHCCLLPCQQRCRAHVTVGRTVTTVAWRHSRAGWGFHRLPSNSRCMDSTLCKASVHRAVALQRADRNRNSHVARLPRGLCGSVVPASTPQLFEFVSKILHNGGKTIIKWSMIRIRNQLIIIAHLIIVLPPMCNILETTQ